jgi:hypothetical protein
MLHGEVDRNKNIMASLSKPERLVPKRKRKERRIWFAQGLSDCRAGVTLDVVQ